MNVALAASRLGVKSECVGFLQRESARMFEDKLAENGTGHDFVILEGRTRTNIKLRDEKTGLITEINQSGRAVCEEDIARMRALVAAHAQEGGFLVFAGSLPPGCPADTYKTLISIASERGCRCALDADGARLSEGIKAKPFLIKPNRYELQLMTGRELASLSDIRSAALSMVETGVSVVAVSLGAEGALITNGEESLFARALDIPVRSTVGAGDSMVAGMTAGFHDRAPLERAFRMGVAASAAACMTEGTRTFNLSDYEALFSRVAVERIN